MALPEEFITRLIQNNPIETVAAGYVTLKRSSRDYVCLCPFHSENTPSCHINVGGQYFHCFGCGAGGNVITFIMKAENLEFIEAVRFLAEKSGIPMPEEAKDNAYSVLKAKILDINRTAARYFNHILMKDPAGEKGRMYFRSRQLSVKTITKYGLGYAPDDWHRLTDYLKSQGYTEEEIITANLSKPGRNGGVYDSFRDRVMFPIIDLRGNVIAFGGRIIDGEGPKYLNSSDTPVFKKSRNLFSLNFAKKSSERKLILAEGYMDVIAVNQGGFENVVATLGTALTPEQARLMSQYADEVIIAYDSDGAGQNATHKAINLLGEAGVRTRIIKMEGAKDPDEYIKKFGANRFRQLIESSDGAVNFELEKCRNGIDMNSETGKVEYLKKCVDVLASISSSVERSVYISKLSRENDISRDALEGQINSVIRKRIKATQNREWNDIRTFSDKRRYDPDMQRYPKEYRAEQGIIAGLHYHPDSIEYLKKNLTADMFVTDFHRKIYTMAAEGMERSSDFSLLGLQSELSADETGKIASIISDYRSIEINDETIRDFVNILKKASEKKGVSPGEMSDEEFLKKYSGKKC